MKKILLLLIIASSPAAAKTWHGCEESLHAKDGVYSFVSDHSPHLKCEILFWPSKNPVALLSCDNGKYSTFEMASADKIYFDDFAMFAEESGKDACGVE